MSEAEVALIPRESLRPSAKLPLDGLVAGCGETVGNKPEGLVRVLSGLGTAGAGIVGSGGGGLVLGAGLVVKGAGFLAATILTEPVALKEAASFAFAFAMSVRWSPGLASFRTATRTCSSSAWPWGRFPRAQVAPLASGQTENCGAAAPLTWRIEALTAICLALPWVLQTQTM